MVFFIEGKKVAIIWRLDKETFQSAALVCQSEALEDDILIYVIARHEAISAIR
jgi:hypothetical protein